jgi:hypothetical protein
MHSFSRRTDHPYLSSSRELINLPKRRYLFERVLSEVPCIDAFSCREKAVQQVVFLPEFSNEIVGE